MCLLLTNGSPSIDALSHMPPLPLVIDYSDRTKTITREDEDNIYFGLQQHGRVRQLTLQGPSSRLRMWLKPMNNLFPSLGDLSLLSTTTEGMSLVLPETLQAPNLCRLSLHSIGLPKGLPLLSSTIALSKLTLAHIGASCYFPPGHLVTQLQSLPLLEELSIGFSVSIPLPSSEGEPLPPPIPPVTLPTLRRFTFRGEDSYLENIVAQINTPLLECLSLTFFFDLTFTLVKMTELINRTERFEFLVARVIFNKDGAAIDAGLYEQQDIGKISLRVNCEPVDWQIDSATQVCIAIGNILSTVEVLTLDLHVDGMPPDWENTLDNAQWHELLLPFIGVKKLHIGLLLTSELSQALESVAGELASELLPELQELEVPLEIDQATNSFSTFIETRESVGRPIRLLVPSGVAAGSSLSTNETLAAPLQNTLAAQRSQRRRRRVTYQPELEDVIDAGRKEKRWQARALGLVGRLRGKGQD